MKEFRDLWSFAKPDITSFLHRAAANIISILIKEVDDYFEKQIKNSKKNATDARAKSEKCETQEAREVLLEQSILWQASANSSAEHQMNIRNKISDIVNELLSQKNILPRDTRQQH